jgi:L-lactate dehydrogenase complex protein LldF
VRIDIPAQLYAWRQVVARDGLIPRGRQRVLWIAGQVLSRPALYRVAARWTRRALRVLPRFVVYGRYNVWGRARELPDPPKRSFREWYGGIEVRHGHRDDFRRVRRNAPDAPSAGA